MKLAIGIFLILGVLTGCSISTTQLEADFNAPKVSGKNKETMLVDIECPIKLFEFKDLRKSKSLGLVAFTIVESNVEAWTKSALSHYNIKESNSANVGHIKVGLVKAYIQSMMSSMSANVVFSVNHYDAQTKMFGERILFRGHDVSTNWNSGDGEISETLNTAISNALLKLKQSFKKECETNKS